MAKEDVKNVNEATVEGSQLTFMTEDEVNAIRKELENTKMALVQAEAKIAKQNEAINKLINAMATRYAQDLLKEAMPD